MFQKKILCGAKSKHHEGHVQSNLINLKSWGLDLLFRIFSSSNYVIVIPWVVSLYMEIIHEL